MGRESAGCSSSRPAQPRRTRAGEARGVFTDRVSSSRSSIPRYCGAHVSSCVESPRSAPILPGKAGLSGALQLPPLYCVVKVQVAPLPPPASLCSPPGPRPASITRLQFNCYQGFLQFRRGPSSRYSISLPADSVWSPCTLQGT